MIYCIYIKREGLEPSLYAYTNEKELIDNFKKERNMDRFTIITHDEDDMIGDVTIKNYLAKKYSKLRLVKRTLSTYTGNDFHVEDKVTITITDEEDWKVFKTSSNIVDEFVKIVKDVFIFRNSFNHKIKDALKILQFYVVCDYALEKLIINSDYGDIYSDNYFKDTGFFKPDDLNIFISLYGNTLKRRDT